MKKNKRTEEVIILKKKKKTGEEELGKEKKVDKEYDDDYFTKIRKCIACGKQFSELKNIREFKCRYHYGDLNEKNIWDCCKKPKGSSPCVLSDHFDRQTKCISYPILKINSANQSKVVISLCKRIEKILENEKYCISFKENEIICNRGFYKKKKYPIK
jgi:hypothetical protein